MKANFINQTIIACLLLLCSCDDTIQQEDTIGGLSDSLSTDSVKVTNIRTGVKMEKSGGVYTIPCNVNGVRMKFIFDTGASNVCISATEALFLYKNGYLEDSDFDGVGYSQVADGRIVENMEINLHSIDIEGIIITDVRATVANSIEAPLLLGQSAIQKLGRIEISGDSLFIETPRPVTEQREEPKASDNPIIKERSWWSRFISLFSNDDEIEELLEQADKAISMDLYELAETLCQQAISMDEDNWKPYALLGIVADKQYKHGESINAFEKYEELNTDQQTLELNNGVSYSFNYCIGKLLCRSYFFQKRYQEAMAKAQEIIMRDKDFYYDYSLIATTYAENGDFSKAEMWAKKLLELSKNSSDKECKGEANFRMAWIYSEMGRKKEAIRYYEKCIEEKPEYGLAFSNLADLYMNINYQYAWQLKRKAAKLGNENAQQWMREKGYDW